ncbi:rab-GTPase-TBC domain-containing protein [Polychytrium aggregatum]|uniref:rab-GTPase-TBC domain-containing protein n=1 Tax=Polychytrium aggregatum TaxID=110093 RepID=UPI0022FE5422|nr:rab-GTPase-TBC domain-containing protein [Polychytrium aggregatum]KAI9197168.1 rab-GTPase-TBC domain-containing protein [Polychytrium aggregatum]
MFIKPLDLAAVADTNVWQAHAGNQHFALQSRKQTPALKSLFSFANIVPLIPVASSPDAALKRQVADAEFRIILRCANKKEYVVAVDATFEKIHMDWNWIESHLFLKLAELEAADSAPTPEHVDSIILAQFIELHEEYHDPKSASEQAKLLDLKYKMNRIFPSLEDEVVLQGYKCIFLSEEGAPIRGQFLITRNYACFYESDAVDRPTSQTALSVAFKDILSLQIVSAKREMLSDPLQISITDRKYNFSSNLYRREIFRALTNLTNAAMHRLIKGAENSGLSLADMYAKASTNMTGDLSNNSMNRGGGLFAMGKLREEISSLKGASLNPSRSWDEEDFADTRLSEGQTPRPSMPSEKRSDPILQPLLNHSEIVTKTINSVGDLDMQTKGIEFRNLFRLPAAETISIEESPCYFWHKSTSTSHAGTLYLTERFLCFVSLSISNPSNVAQIGLNALSKVTLATVTDTYTSLLFDSPQDPILVFSVPYSHITSVKKQQPTALTQVVNLTSFSMSGYLVISSRSKAEYWLSFSAVPGKARDKISDEILQRMKSVDWTFDDDLVVGGRNGSNTEAIGVGASPTNPKGVYDAGSKKSSSTSMEEFMSSIEVLKTEETFAANMGIEEKVIPIVEMGLKLLFEDRDAAKTDDSSLEKQKQWGTYLDMNGRDICMVKDFRAIRELIIKTGGLPDSLRGDFWMICSGAWYSRPKPGYYRNMLRSNTGRVSFYIEEIEKDVRRSLPEHPAYQSNIGIDALRRILTTYSWRNPAVGYAQALNIITAVLLLHLKEEDAFWMLCTIVESLLPDHYSKTLVGSVVDQEVFTWLVEQHLPAVSAQIGQLYMDLSTISVPWFVCLFLNSVSLRMAPTFLDAFFVDGPKFLFWTALAILKHNEKELIQSGRDDDIFIGAIRGFFQRLSGPDSSPGDTKASGYPLLAQILSLAYGTFGPLISTETIEALRARFRLKVVHQMEETSRKSQVRNLCEQVSLKFDEVAMIYDEVRRLEYKHEENLNDGHSEVLERSRSLESEMRSGLIQAGGWGILTNALSPSTDTSDNGGFGSKALTLVDFRSIFRLVSPWRSGVAIGDRGKDEKQVGLAICLMDRIFHYCSIHHSFQGSDDKNAGLKVPLVDPSKKSMAFIVDLATVVHVLDIITKQPLHARLRFLFDLHDVDGDSFLSELELKAVMDSLLEMFDQSRQEPVRSNAPVSPVSRGDEAYLAAVSSFLNTALKIGGGKSQSESTGSSLLMPLHQLKKMEKSSTSLRSVGPGQSSLSGLRPEATGPSRTMAEDLRAKQQTASPVLSLPKSSGRARSASTSSSHLSRTSTEKNTPMSVRTASNSKNGNHVDDSAAFRLSFNEFLLAILSQSVFVEFFERIWTLVRGPDGSMKLSWKSATFAK